MHCTRVNFFGQTLTPINIFSHTKIPTPSFSPINTHTSNLHRPIHGYTFSLTYTYTPTIHYTVTYCQLHSSRTQNFTRTNLMQLSAANPHAAVQSSYEFWELTKSRSLVVNAAAMHQTVDFSCQHFTYQYSLFFVLF